MCGGEEVDVGMNDTVVQIKRGRNEKNATTRDKEIGNKGNVKKP